MPACLPASGYDMDGLQSEVVLKWLTHGLPKAVLTHYSKLITACILYTSEILFTTAQVLSRDAQVHISLIACIPFLFSRPALRLSDFLA